MGDKGKGGIWNGKQIKESVVDCFIGNNSSRVAALSDMVLALHSNGQVPSRNYDY
jgi:hypothetical protein